MSAEGPGGVGGVAAGWLLPEKEEGGREASLGGAGEGIVISEQRLLSDSVSGNLASVLKPSG